MLLTVMKNLDTFIARLEKIGLKVELAMNYPWVYLEKIDGKMIKEKRSSEYAFTLGFMPKYGEVDFSFLETQETFRIIRKYSSRH